MTREPWTLTRDMFLSEAEVEELLQHLHYRVKESAGTARDAALTDELIIQGLLFSGLRNSEFCQLCVGDTIVGLRQSVFRVRGTPRQDRTVYVPNSLSDLVRNYVKDVRPRALPNGIKPGDRGKPLVINDRGRPYERTNLYRRVVRILGEAGLKDRASVQLLRHTYGYLGYKRAGGNLLFLQKQMGHAHPMVTSIYAEFVHEDYSRLANLIGEAGS